VPCSTGKELHEIQVERLDCCGARVMRKTCWGAQPLGLP